MSEFYIDGCNIEFVGDLSEDVGLWQDQHAFFGAIGVVHDAYEIWLNKRRNEINLSLGDFNIFSVKSNVNLFSEFLNSIGIWK